MHQQIAISTEQGSSKRHEIKMNGLKILASIIADHHIAKTLSGNIEAVFSKDEDNQEHKDNGQR